MEPYFLGTSEAPSSLRTIISGLPLPPKVGLKGDLVILSIPPNHRLSQDDHLLTCLHNRSLSARNAILQVLPLWRCNAKSLVDKTQPVPVLRPVSCRLVHDKHDRPSRLSRPLVAHAIPKDVVTHRVGRVGNLVKRPCVGQFSKHGARQCGPCSGEILGLRFGVSEVDFHLPVIRSFIEGD